VLEEAARGLFQEGWFEFWGLDADHIKAHAEIESFLAAGYTLFTFDPGDHVDSAADTDFLETLHSKVRALPWEPLRSSPEALYQEYLDSSFELEGRRLTFDEATLLRAAAKYSLSIAMPPPCMPIWGSSRVRACQTITPY
jgi:hypothetical protein